VGSPMFDKWKMSVILSGMKLWMQEFSKEGSGSESGDVP